MLEHETCKPQLAEQMQEYMIGASWHVHAVSFEAGMPRS